MGFSDIFKRRGASRAQEDQRIQDLLDRAAQNSPVAKRILDQALGDGIRFSMQPGIKDIGTYDDNKRSVFLNPNMSDEVLLGTLVHEARHSGQSIYFTSTNTVEAAVKINRAAEADAMAVQCAAVFEMRLSNPKIFEEFRAKHPEIAKAYEEEARASKDTQKALSSAFKTWYRDTEYVDGYDRDVAAFMKKHYSPTRSLRIVSDRDLIKDLCPYMRHDKEFFASKEANTMKRDTYDTARKIELDRAPSSRSPVRTSLDTMRIRESDGKITEPMNKRYPPLSRMTPQNIASRLGRLSSR